jgi:hypothetical protein
VRAKTKSKVIPAAVKIAFESKAHIDIATKRAISTVKIRNNGKGYALNVLVMQLIIKEIANIPTETIIMTGICSINL